MRLLDWLVVWFCFDRYFWEKFFIEKVIFQIGSFIFLEFDFESCMKKMEEWMKVCGFFLEVREVVDIVQDLQIFRSFFKFGFQENVCCFQNQFLEGDEGEFDKGFVEDRGSRNDIVVDVVGQFSYVVNLGVVFYCVVGIVGGRLEVVIGLYVKVEEGFVLEFVVVSCVQWGFGFVVVVNIFCGDDNKKVNFRIEGDIF